MKKFILVVVMAIGTTFLMAFTNSNGVTEVKEVVMQSKFDEGFEDGYCEGWKSEKGELVVCPVAPVAPVPNAYQSFDSYKDGYNTGFKAGMKAAIND